MPIATGVNLVTKRFELKSCPGGFVVLRRLTYGEKLQRQGFMSKAVLTSDEVKGTRSERRARQAQSFKAELDLANAEVSKFEFATCIIEHNLEYDNNGNPALLDFHNPTHVAMLDGNIGQEIDELINEFNDFEGAIDEETRETDTGKSKSDSTT